MLAMESAVAATSNTGHTTPQQNNKTKTTTTTTWTTTTNDNNNTQSRRPNAQEDYTIKLKKKTHDPRMALPVLSSASPPVATSPAIQQRPNVTLKLNKIIFRDTPPCSSTATQYIQVHADNHHCHCDSFARLGL